MTVEKAKNQSNWAKNITNTLKTGKNEKKNEKKGKKPARSQIIPHTHK